MSVQFFFATGIGHRIDEKFIGAVFANGLMQSERTASLGSPNMLRPSMGKGAYSLPHINLAIDSVFDDIDCAELHDGTIADWTDVMSIRLDVAGLEALLSRDYIEVNPLVGMGNVAFLGHIGDVIEKLFAVVCLDEAVTAVAIVELDLSLFGFHASPSAESQAF